MRTDPIVIVSAARTAQGNLLGALKEVSAPQLGSNVIQTVVERAALTAFDIQEVWMGCVLSAGLGQAPARQASLAAGLSVHTPCTTINKMCGSGMQAVISAYDKLRVGHQAIYVAGGMESMTQAPYLLLKARQGYRLGHSQLIDHMMADGLEDAYHPHPMGYFAELCAREYGLTREQQDQYALASLERAQSAIKKQYFKAEISPVVVKTPKSEQIVDIDERPGSVNKEKIPTLPAIFLEGGTITAANSSSISDGAAALILMPLSLATQRGLTPLAQMTGYTTYADSPDQFPTAPIFAIRQLLSNIRWSITDVDLFEINEAFAVVALAAMQELAIPHEKLNIHGGGCALGHPIGASGARIMVTLMNALRIHHLKRGIAAACIGGGEAIAVALELMSG